MPLVSPEEAGPLDALSYIEAGKSREINVFDVAIPSFEPAVLKKGVRRIVLKDRATAAFDFVTGPLTADPHWSEFTDPPNPGLLEVIERIFLLSNDPYLKYVNMFDQGYAVVDVTPEETIVEYRLLETLDEQATVRTGARFRLVDGARTLETLFDERPIPRVVPG